MPCTQGLDGIFGIAFRPKGDDFSGKNIPTGEGVIGDFLVGNRFFVGGCLREEDTKHKVGGLKNCFKFQPDP